MVGGFSELVPITGNALLEIGADKVDERVYSVMLDDERRIDFTELNYRWTFQLIQEPKLGNCVSTFEGREIRYMNEVLDLYRILTGKEYFG